MTRSLGIITLTGAHGTGKSTLAKDLSDHLSLQQGVVTVPSCSTELFQREQMIRPELKTYDDINRLGLRFTWQQRLPGMLADLVLRTMNRKPTPDVIIVDRWFSDIAAYSAMELSTDENSANTATCISVKNLFIRAVTALIAQTDVHLSILHLFVPLSASQFSITDTKPQRATCDRDQWEHHCRGLLDRFCPPERTLHITTTDRQARVRETCRRLDSDADAGSGFP